MTTNSTRRAAEMAVVAAAHRYVADPQGPATYRKLIAAVEVHERIGLDATVQPTIGNQTTDTSTAAGASVRKTVGALAQQCLDEIIVVTECNGYGLTVDQIEIILNRSHQSVSARVNELRDKGWIQDSGHRRPTRSGRKAIVWEPTGMTS